MIIIGIPACSRDVAANLDCAGGGPRWECSAVQPPALAWIAVMPAPPQRGSWCGSSTTTV